MPRCVFALCVCLALVACDDEDTTCPCDQTAPTVAITSPADGDTVPPAQPVTFEIAATDDRSLDRVQVLIDGALLGDPDLTPPWSAVWDPTGLDNGPYTFTARATDSAGNIATSAPALVRLGFCDEYELAGILSTLEDGTVVGGDMGDWCTAGDAMETPLRVLPARPNPFYPTCVIRFTLAAATQVTVRMVNQRCETVRTLIDDMRPAGVHEVVWNAANDDGMSLPGGIYGCVVEIDGASCYGDIMVQNPVPAGRPTE